MKYSNFRRLMGDIAKGLEFLVKYHNKKNNIYI